MRSASLLLASMVVLLSAAAAAAGPGLFAGGSLPTGDLADGWKVGWHGGVQLMVPVTPLGSVGVRGTFNRLAPDPLDGVPGDPPEGHLDLIELLAVGRLSLVSGPFLMAGLGVTRSDGKWGATDLDSAVDFTAAAGLGFRLLPFEVTALYHNVAAEGASFSYLSLSAGIGF